MSSAGAQRAPAVPVVDAAALAACMVAVAVARDRAAFATLFAHFAPRVKAYLLRLGMTDAKAEELAQETMLLVWRKAAQCDAGRGAVSTWIFAISRNLRTDAVRRDRRQGAALDGAPDNEALQQAAAMVPDGAPDAESMAASAQRMARLREALRSLSEKQKHVLELAYFGERSHSEVARDLRLPLGTVKARLQQALAQLRGVLDGEEL